MINSINPTTYRYYNTIQKQNSPNFKGFYLLPEKIAEKSIKVNTRLENIANRIKMTGYKIGEIRSEHDIDSPLILSFRASDNTKIRISKPKLRNKDTYTIEFSENPNIPKVMPSPYGYSDVTKNDSFKITVYNDKKHNIAKFIDSDHPDFQSPDMFPSTRTNIDMWLNKYLNEFLKTKLRFL